MFTFENGFHKEYGVYRFVLLDGQVFPANTKTDLALIASHWHPRPNAIAVWSVPCGTKIVVHEDEKHTNGMFYGWLVWQEPN